MAIDDWLKEQQKQRRQAEEKQRQEEEQARSQQDQVAEALEQNVRCLSDSGLLERIEAATESVAAQLDSAVYSKRELAGIVVSKSPVQKEEDYNQFAILATSAGIVLEMRGVLGPHSLERLQKSIEVLNQRLDEAVEIRFKIRSGEPVPGMFEPKNAEESLRLQKVYEAGYGYQDSHLLEMIQERNRRYRLATTQIDIQRIKVDDLVRWFQFIVGEKTAKVTIEQLYATEEQLRRRREQAEQEAREARLADATPTAFSAAPTAFSDKSRVAAGVRGLLLGGIGAHSFYLGNIGKGVIQIIFTLITFGFGGCWGMIEGIIILAGWAWRDAQGRPLRKYNE
jgi:TM2 domain-containing membrane protein YozV